MSAVSQSEIAKQLDLCVKCGACMAVCPVYLAQRHERGVARGKLALIKEREANHLAATSGYMQTINACLLCGSCTQSCPNQVDTKSVVQAARARLVLDRKSSRIKRFVFGRLLPSRRLWPLVLKGLRLGRVVWAKRVPAESGMYLRLFRDGSGRRRKIPDLVAPFFLDRKHVFENHTDGARVAVFTGCLGNYMHPQAVEGIISFLQRNRYGIQVPAAQGCCGLAAFGVGDNRAARNLAVRNLDALLPAGAAWPDYITTPCASCAYMLKNHLPELISDDPQRAERAKELASRVVPFSRLWEQMCRPARVVAAENTSKKPVLTYHDPCHLSRGFGEKDAPRNLLQSLSGAGFVEMEHPCKCCGHGGSFNISNYDLSLEIAQKKVDGILSSGADVVVTECSGCLLQLLDALAKVKPDIEVITTAESFLRYS